MKKEQNRDEELQQLWEEEIGPLAYELEEAFLQVFKNKPKYLQKPAFFLSAIAMTAGHVLQVSEKMFDYKHPLRDSFDDVMTQTYNHYRLHPSDEEDGEPSVPSIDWSMMN